MVGCVILFFFSVRRGAFCGEFFLTMSSIYANGLSKFRNKGKCGQPEKFDDPDELDCKIDTLVEHIRASKTVVVHTGAGISTAAGIPDFRGPKGVWTLEKKGKKPQVDKSFDEAHPTLTHMALIALLEKGFISFVVSQNIDGLHLRSGLPRRALAELHGNILVSRCDACDGLFVQPSTSETVGQKLTGEICPSTKTNGRRCRGKLLDTILDWNAGLPKDELDLAEAFSEAADLSIAMGTTLQIVPSGTLPARSKKLVICNLQPTKYDTEADLVISAYVDTIMEKLCQRLGVTIPEYNPENDPFLQLKKNVADFGDTDGLNDHAIAVEWRVYTERLLEFPKKEEEEPKAKRRRTVVEKREVGGTRGRRRRRGHGWTVTRKKEDVKIEPIGELPVEKDSAELDVKDEFKQEKVEVKEEEKIVKEELTVEEGRGENVEDDAPVLAEN